MKRLLILIPFISVFIISIYKPYDADLGWHLKYGEYFFTHHQILRDNIFAVDMPNFHWQNSSWGVDLISYLVFHSAGFFGLSIAAALIITLTFFFFARAAKLNLWQQVLIFPLIVYLEKPINQVSFRGQLISLLLMGVMAYILSLYNGKSKKMLLFLIPLFFIWVNVHGEFLVGLGLFLAWIFFYLLKEILFHTQKISSLSKEAGLLIIILLASALVTLINPFGLGVYQDVLSHFGNPELKKIIEYLPFDTYSNLWWNHIILGVLLVLGVIYLLLNGKYKQQIPFIGLALLLFAFTLEVRRYAWPTYYFAIPILAPLAASFEPTKKRVHYLVTTFLLVILLILAIKIQWPLNQSLTYGWQNYCTEYANCSPKGAQALIDHHLASEKLLTFYNWGGWLIWNYPQIKPSIDGRMHLWRDEKGYSAFEHYYPIEQNIDDVNDSDYNVVFMSPEKPVYKRLLQLTEQGTWKKVYEDQNSGIFVRNN